MEQPFVRISEQELERQLAAVRRRAAGPREGLFGPDSVTWRVNREAAVFLGAGRALLLQLAHPWVAAGIAEHSTTLRDPIGRFHRTFDVVYTMVFGATDQAIEAARRLYRRHATISGKMPESVGPFARGSAYWANERSALRWVFATLVDSAVTVHDQVLPPLGPAERELYYAESFQFAGLFGLGPETLPPDWAAFSDYVGDMIRSEGVTVSAAGRDIAGRLLAGEGSFLGVPAWYRALTAKLLPERLRAGFGLPYGEPERRNAERALRRIQRFYPLLPARLRHVGPYQEAQARLAGRSRPDRITRSLNRLWIGRPEAW